MKKQKTRKQKTRKQKTRIRGGGCGTSKSHCKQKTLEEALAYDDINNSSRGNNRKLPVFYTLNSVPKNIIVKNDSSFPVHSPNSLSRKKTIKK